MKKILTAGLSPAIQKVILFDSVDKNTVNRSSSYLICASGKSINTCRVLIQAGIDAQAIVPAGIENMEHFKELCRNDHIPMTVSKHQEG